MCSTVYRRPGRLEQQRSRPPGRDSSADASSTLEAEHDEQRRHLGAEDGARGAWEWDIVGGIVSYSPGAKAMLGLLSGNIGESFEEFMARVHPDDRDFVRYALDSHLCGDTRGFELEFRMCRQDGRYVWVASRGMIGERLADGAPLRMAGTATDVTERKGYEQEIRELTRNLGRIVADRTSDLASATARAERSVASLRRSEARFRTVFEQAPLGMVLFDSTTGRIHDVNARFAKITGRPRDELLGLDWQGLTHPADIAASAELHERVNSGAAADVPIVKRYLRPDGTVVWARVAVAPVALDDADAPHHMAMVEDITAEKNAEEKLQAASEAKTAFLGTVSHELRTPLNAIIGFSSLILDGLGDEVTAEQHQQVAIIRRAGARLLELIQDILDFTTIQGRYLPVYPVTLSLGRVIEEQCNAARSACEERGIEMRQPRCAETVVVRADPARLRQVLSHLLSNAVKFTDHGHVQVSATSEGEFARVVVEDSGIGIPADHRDHLFKPFERVADTHKLRQGTGLGLAIAERLVRAMRGSIGFESADGGGTRFWFTLPLKPDTN